MSISFFGVSVRFTLKRRCDAPFIGIAIFSAALTNWYWKKLFIEQGLCVKDAEGGDEGAGAEAFGRGTDTLQQPGRAVA